MSNGTPHVAFFVPKVIYLLADHAQGMGRTEIEIEALRQAHDVGGFDSSIVISSDKHELLTTFSAPNREGRQLSLVRLSAPLDDVPLLSTVLQANQKFPHPLPPVKSGEPSLAVVAASPDWLVGGAQPTRPVGTGGPGGTHTDLSGVSFTPDFALPPKLKAENPALSETIDVYLLDSEPLTTDTVITLELSGSRAAVLHIEDNDELKVYRSEIPNEIYLPQYPPPQSTPPATEGAPVPAHGIFVASLIAAVVGSIGASESQLKERLRLHLIPILNKHCIGSMSSFAAGLAQLQTLRATEKTPFIVNMSIAFADPLYALFDAMWQPAVGVPQTLQTIFDALLLMLQAGTTFPMSDEGNYISAAGNKGGLTDNAVLSDIGQWFNLVFNRQVPQSVLNVFFPPTFPANSDSVGGIGALDATLSAPAAYSFLADVGYNPDPLPGIWAFGGDMQAGKGLVGQVENGFVAWEGTSFAAAVVSGIEAICLACGLKDSTGAPRKVQYFCQELDDASGTKIGVKLADVTQ